METEISVVELEEMLEMARLQMARLDMARYQMEFRKMLDSQDLEEGFYGDLKMGRREMVISEDRTMGPFEDLRENASEYPQMMASEDLGMGVFKDMGISGFDNKPESQASSLEITTLNDIQEVPDPEMGFTPAEREFRQARPNSGIWTRCRDYLSWATKAKRYKPHQPRPSENAEPGPEPPHDDDYGKVKETKGLSKVTLATEMILPAAVGWGGCFVIGQGALYNSALAFSVFGFHVLGILCMFIGCYLGNHNPRVSGRMQKLGQALCIACLILTQIPVSKKL